MPFPNPDTQFKPGAEWKGNAKGRPRIKPLTDILQAMFKEKAKDGTSMAEHFVRQVLVLAMKGDARLACAIWDRLDGKAPERIEISGVDGGAIEVNATIQQQAQRELERWRAEMRDALAELDRNGAPSNGTSARPT